VDRGLVSLGSPHIKCKTMYAMYLLMQFGHGGGDEVFQDPIFPTDPAQRPPTVASLQEEISGCRD
jgi:hypothetical protein